MNNKYNKVIPDNHKDRGLWDYELDIYPKISSTFR